MSDTVLELSNIKRHYTQGKNKLSVLKGVDLTLKAGKSVALIGPSGAGKTTLLQIAGLLDQPSSGKLVIAGNDPTKANDETKAKLRRDHIGMVYQLHHLLPDFTAEENVMIPQMIRGVTKAKAKEKAKEVLGFLGLEGRLGHKPAELSGGQQQRVAIARAIVNRPSVILADEPTGNLDPDTAKEVFNLLLSTIKEMNAALLVVTHNMELAKQTDQLLSLDHGVIV